MNFSIKSPVGASGQDETNVSEGKKSLEPFSRKSNLGFYLLRFFSSRRLDFMVNGFLVMSFVRVPPRTRGLSAPLLPKGRGLEQASVLLWLLNLSR